jgi:hypothetical protein
MAPDSSEKSGELTITCGVDKEICGFGEIIYLTGKSPCRE